jgi:hypothetical protein
MSQMEVALVCDKISIGKRFCHCNLNLSARFFALAGFWMGEGEKIGRTIGRHEK